jgi:hypothetical protein
MLILALATTVSANVGGCKNADNDANADIEGYTDALPTFCRDKRAAAAFFWLNFCSSALPPPSSSQAVFPSFAEQVSTS